MGTLRSLLKELACLTVLNNVKQASSFNRDLRVAHMCAKVSKIESNTTKKQTTSSYSKTFHSPICSRQYEEGTEFMNSSLLVLVKHSEISYPQLKKNLARPGFEPGSVRSEVDSAYH